MDLRKNMYINYREPLCCHFTAIRGTSATNVLTFQKNNYLKKEENKNIYKFDQRKLVYGIIRKLKDFNFS